MSTRSDLNDEQAYWLRRVLETGPRASTATVMTIPGSFRETLADKGLIRPRQDVAEITLDGVEAVARYKPFHDPEKSRNE